MRVGSVGLGRGSWCCSAALALFVGACGTTERTPPVFLETPSDPGAAGAGAGAGGAATHAVPELEAVPSQLQQLNSAEYAATIEDTLGAEVRLPGYPDGEIGGFDNIASAQFISGDRYQTLLDAAERAADAVFGAEALKARVVSCAQADDTLCMDSVITQLGRRLFRRPVLAEEVPVYEKVYRAARQRGSEHDEAIKQVLIALLASAQFLYRMEFVGEEPGRVLLGPYELASRLSYLLWSSAPDDALLEAAADGSLPTDAGLTTQLARMWDDRKSQRFVTNFAGQWLGARDVPFRPKAPDVFPQWNTEVADAAGQEIYSLFDEVLRQDQDIGALYDSSVHFVNGALGQLYGLDVTGSETQRTTIEGTGRSGYLGLVGMLAYSSSDRRTSPTLRGRFILQNLLCLELPRAPETIPKLDIGPEPTSFRARVDGIRAKPECATCHRLTDPLGLALEHYDGIGRYRDAYSDGEVIDARQVLWDGEAVDGLPGVIDWFKRQPGMRSCLLEKLYNYGMNRMLGAEDERNVAALDEQLAASPLTIKRAVEALVLAKPFRFRSDGGSR